MNGKRMKTPLASSACSELAAPFVRPHLRSPAILLPAVRVFRIDRRIGRREIDIMTEPDIVPDHERATIRAQLQAYLNAHAIGVPRLQQLMDETLDAADKPFVNLRSLQRFITDSVRIEDAKVIRYRKFLKIVQGN